MASRCLKMNSRYPQMILSCSLKPLDAPVESFQKLPESLRIAQGSLQVPSENLQIPAYSSKLASRCPPNDPQISKNSFLIPQNDLEMPLNNPGNGRKMLHIGL